MSLIIYIRKKNDNKSNDCPQIQVPLKTSFIIHTKTKRVSAQTHTHTLLRYIIFKLLTPKTKENLKPEKIACYLQSKKDKNYSRFFSGKNASKNKMDDIFKQLREKYCQLIYK